MKEEPAAEGAKASEEAQAVQQEASEDAMQVDAGAGDDPEGPWQEENTEGGAELREKLLQAASELDMATILSSLRP